MTTIERRRGATIATASQAARGLHPVAGAGWLAASLTMVFLTSNPLYVATIGLAALVVYASSRGAEQRAMDYLLATGVALATLTVPLNLLAGSTGGSELVSLPSVRLPAWLGSVTFGGPITSESLVYAAGQAAGLATLLVIVFAFNANVDHFALLKRVPAGLAQLGIIITIGVLLIPETLTRATALRESRLLRGHRTNGAAALVALALPLLATALERSVQRAESLDARGFGRIGRERRAREAVAAVGGIALAAFGAFWYYYAHAPALALAAVACGIAVVGVTVLRTGRKPAVVRLSSASLGRQDYALLGISAMAVVAFAAARAAGSGGIAYLPFPEVSVPGFSPLPAIACASLALPALFAPGNEHQG